MTRRTVASAVAFGTLVLVGTAASAHAQEEPRDRDLTPRMRLTEGQIEDAWGDYAVALVPGDFDTPALALLRLRAP